MALEKMGHTCKNWSLTWKMGHNGENRSNLSLYIFWLIRSLVDPTLAAFIVCGPLQFVLLNYEFLDRRSSQIRYAAFLKHGTGHAFECLGWLCPATFRDTNTDTLSPCAPKHVMWQRVFGGASEFKVPNLI